MMEVKISKGPESIMVDEKEEYVRKIERLQEQLSEANDIIKYYAEKHGKLKACDYLNKWGIK